MHRQQPLALAPPAGDADWGERTLLDGATRRALASVNQAFLDLAAELAEEGRLRQIAGLPPRAVDALMTGQTENVHQTMVALQKADASFQLMMQVRNKLVAAYEEMNRMQI